MAYEHRLPDTELAEIANEVGLPLDALALALAERRHESIRIETSSIDLSGHRSLLAIEWHEDEVELEAQLLGLAGVGPMAFVLDERATVSMSPIAEPTLSASLVEGCARSKGWVDWARRRRSAAPWSMSAMARSVWSLT
ncbi:MAG: hypothetical protein R2706_03950 [Acidimicrobiales bacterium]